MKKYNLLITNRFTGKKFEAVATAQDETSAINKVYSCLRLGPVHTVVITKEIH